MADGLSVDTSTYPKAPAPVNALDTAAKFQGLQQGAQQLQSGQLIIDKQKLDNANQALGYTARAINSLGASPTASDVKKILQNTVDMGLAPQAMVDQAEAQIPTDPKLMPAWVDKWRAATADHSQMMQQMVGSPVIENNGQQYYVVRAPQSPNQPVTVQGTGIQPQIPPTTPVTDTATTLPNGQPNPNAGQPRLYGTQPLPVAPGAGNGAAPQSAAPPARTAPSALPVSPPPMPPANSTTFNPPVKNKDQSQVAQGNPIPGQPTGPATGMPPQFDEGRKQYNDDINVATQRQSALKPALQALPLLKQLQTAGPGSNAFNSAVAGLKNFGILPTNIGNDPTAIYQEVEKKLAQYVGSNPVGARSDAAQALAEAGSPNPNHQIRPALIQLTKDAIGLDRLAAARAPAFTQKVTNPDGSITQAPRTDYQNYPTFRAGFPPSIDEKAFTLDTLDPDERKTLLDKMKAQKDTPTGQRFWKSLQTVKDLNLYNISGE